MAKNNDARIVKSDIWEAVSQSGVLGTSKNQSALFKYLLDHSYNEARPDIKTKDIAGAVFGRNGDFNAKKDSIVRVEMHRLRANLESFNQQSDSLKLELPKSSYLLEIDKLESHVDTFTGHRKNRFFAGGLVASIAAISFIFAGALTTKSKAEDCSSLIPNIEIAALADESNLSQFVYQVVSGAASQFKHFNIVKNVEACGHFQVPGYKLTYALFERDEGFQGSLSVTSQASGKIVGIGDLSGSTSTPNVENNELYFMLAKITNDLLQPIGVVHRDAVSQTWSNSTKREDYSCLVKMYDSFITDSDEDYFEGLKCLKRSYKNGNSSLENLGALAASYLEQAQGNRVFDGEDPLKQAELILNDIGGKWQQSPESTIAKIMYDSVRKDYNAQQMKETLFLAEKAYSSHPLVILEIARYSGFMLGEWDAAVKIVDRAKRLMSNQDNSVYQVDAAYAVLYTEDPKAWEYCVKAYSQHSKVSNLLVHACSIKYKKPIWEKQTVKNLANFDLIQLEKREAFIKKMGFEPRLSNELLVRIDNNLYD